MNQGTYDPNSRITGVEVSRGMTYKNPKFVQWAIAWLDGTDRSNTSARAAADAAAAADAYAAADAAADAAANFTWTRLLVIAQWAITDKPYSELEPK